MTGKRRPPVSTKKKPAKKPACQTCMCRFFKTTRQTELTEKKVIYEDWGLIDYKEALN
jgi:hypothetical protein